MPEPGPPQRPTGGSPGEADSDEDAPSGSESQGAAFRISVDLSEYFQQPAHCFLWVPRPQRREARTVRWLARRLRTAAALRTRFCLLCDNHALPPKEPLQLLQAGDSLRVVQAKHDWQRVFSFRGERATLTDPSKPKKRCRDVDTESPTLAPVPKSKPSLPSPKPLPPRSLLPPFSLSKPIPPAVFEPVPEPFLPPRSLPSPLALPKPTPAVLSVPTTHTPITTKSLSQEEELQRVKRRALALLQKVEGGFSGGKERKEREGEDEPDGAEDEDPPAKKRRRRVRRRRPLPPVDFEQELPLTTSQASPHAPATSELHFTTATPTRTSVLDPLSIPTPPIFIPTSIPMPNVYPPPSVPMPSLSLASPPKPVVLRRESTPRPPRLVRALDAARPDDVRQPSQEHGASDGPAPLPQTAVPCI